MNNEYKLVRTTPEDWEKIKKNIMNIETTVFEEDVQQDEYDIESTFIDDVSINYGLYDINNNLVGYLMSSPMEDYPFCEDDLHYNKNDSVYLESIAILPEHIGKGLGRKMIETFLDESKKEGYSRITMHVTEENITKLILDMKFKKVEFIEDWIGDRDAWYVEKDLGDSND